VVGASSLESLTITHTRHRGHCRVASLVTIFALKGRTLNSHGFSTHGRESLTDFL